MGIILIKKGFRNLEYPGQDKGIGRHTLPPCTAKRRMTTTNLKTKNNQNCQKIKLYGSLTNKELKKKHSLRPIEGRRWADRAERTHWKGGSSWRTRASEVAAGRADEVAACSLSSSAFTCR